MQTHCSSAPAPAPLRQTLRTWVAVLLAVGSLVLLFFGRNTPGFLLLVLVPVARGAGRRSPRLALVGSPQPPSQAPIHWIGDESDPSDPLGQDSAAHRESDLFHRDDHNRLDI